MKILVLSDLHAYSRAQQDGSRPSYVKAGDNGDDSPTIQFQGLIESEKGPKPDVIVCPGDLGHQADQPGIAFAWDFLKRLAQASSKGLVITTAGNHDIDSRHLSNDIDAKGTLLDLRPSYPITTNLSQLCEADNQSQLMYWARNFCILWVDNCRFLVLNSCAFHGFGKANDVPEHEHGRISGRTLSRIKAALSANNERRRTDGLPQADLNILVCHHHWCLIILSNKEIRARWMAHIN
jgi:3',5'-cyclic AMP phosphodiesterase CpdA